MIEPDPGREITLQGRTFNSNNGATYAIKSSAMLIPPRKYTYKVTYTYTFALPRRGSAPTP